MNILSKFTLGEIEEILSENSSLRGYLQGYLAEYSLKKQLLYLPNVASVVKIPDQSEEKGDLRVTYKGLNITIEVKSIATDSVGEDILNDTWKGTVQIKNTDSRQLELAGIEPFYSSYLKRGEFDILAISCYAVYNDWEFLFMENEHLPSSSKHPDLLKTSFVVNPETTALVSKTIQSLLETVWQKKMVYLKTREF